MKRCGTFVTPFAMGFLLLALSFSYSAETITIDRNTTFQKIWGFGGAANHPVQGLKSNFTSDVQKELLDLLFRTDGNSVGLSIVRLEINGFKDGEIDPNGAEQLTCKPTENGDWDWNTDRYQKWFSTEAQNRSDVHFIAVPWSPPSWMKSNNSVINGGYLLDNAYDKFANYMKEYVFHYKTVEKIDIRWVSVQNEPKNSTPYASCTYTNSAMNTVASKVADAIHGLKLDIMVGAPEGATRGHSKEFLDNMDGATKDKLDFIVTHDYALGNDNPLAGFNKTVINTEVWRSNTNPDDPTITDGIKWATAIKNALNRNEPGWLFWWIVSPLGNNNGEALVYLDANNTYSTPKRLFTIGQFSRWMRYGDERIMAKSTNTNLSVISAKNNKGRAALVVINNSTSAITANVGGLLGASVEAYRTSGSENIKKLADVTITGNSTAVTFPGNSVTTLVETEIPNTIYINPTKDAFVRGGAYAATNYGVNPVLEVKTQDGSPSYARQSYINFSLAGFPGTVETASLKLFRTSGLAAIVVTANECADTLWGENTINWNNKPLIVKPAATATMTETNGWQTFNVGPYVAQRKAAGETSVSFVMIGAEQGGTAQQTFSSKEGANKPILVVTYKTGPAVPSTPVPATPANGATNQALNPTLTWNTASGAISYGVQVCAVADFSAPIVNASTPDLNMAINGLSNGTTYFWRVNATNTVGTSPWSTVFTFSTIPTIPATPTLLAPANAATGISISPTLTWNAVSGATTYRVQVSSVNTFVSTIVDDATPAQPTKAASGLSSATIYYWRVNAKNAGGTSAWSDIWSFTTSAITTIDINPAKDAFVRGGAYAATNYGTNVALEVKNQAADLSYTRQTYINFSLAGFTGTVNTASLQLYRSGGAAPVVVTVHECADNGWGENTITWNNKPSTVKPTATATMTATNGWYSIDVSGYVNARKAVGASAITFVMIGAEQGGTAQQTFSSKEGANKPVLKVVYTNGIGKRSTPFSQIPKINYNLNVANYSKSVLTFTLPSPGAYRITAYSILGAKVREICAGNGVAGFNKVRMRLPQGSYVVHLTTEKGKIQKELTCIR
jgi:glucuronoarabinoxylan endo-1,4-beta-xylanase